MLGTDWGTLSGLLASQWVSVGALVLVAAIEMTRQAEADATETRRRWITNLSLYGVEQVFVWSTAATFNALTGMVVGRSPLAPILDGLGAGARLLAAIMVLDLIEYGVHRAQHAIRPLWRLHAIHHSDCALDVTTSVRHHPLETVASTPIIGIVAGLLGLRVTDLAVFGGVAFLVQVIAHADLRLSPRLMHVVSWVLVTPEVHALHHSRRVAETNSNFGAIFTIWDRLFGTYSWRPGLGRETVVFGVDAYADPRFQGLLGALCQPLAPTEPVSPGVQAAGEVT
jgi:sterol desaturase/sphingolipid hydroxylase (fatty acid hydroxylase superfamily)